MSDETPHVELAMGDRVKISEDADTKYAGRTGTVDMVRSDGAYCYVLMDGAQQAFGPFFKTDVLPIDAP